MAKINLDKYYTPTDLAEYCVKKTKEVIGVKNITEWLEPSAGAGVFLPYLDNNYLAFDIEPEAENIEQANYLELDLPYFKGRCVIGNPPYGRSNMLAVQFFKKAITQGDYVAFVLPISQLNNNMYMYEFDMVYSEDLGKRNYSNTPVHCCLNIYKRGKQLNTKPAYKLKDIKLRVVSRSIYRNDKIPPNYDFSICVFGSGTGKICERENEYCKQVYFNINPKFKDLVFDAIRKADWGKMYGKTVTPSIQQWQIIKYLREQIPQLV